MPLFVGVLIVLGAIFASAIAVGIALVVFIGGYELVDYILKKTGRKTRHLETERKEVLRYKKEMEARLSQADDELLAKAQEIFNDYK